jgi:RHS repeat-associated protein
MLADHLGGTAMVLNNAGGVESEVRYWPYGSTRKQTAAPATDKLYTGQQQEVGDQALGLYNYKARFYSTVLGRFASPDAGTADGLNRYQYVLNNPLRWTDPTGNCAEGVGNDVCKPCELCEALVALDALGIHSPQELDWWTQTVDAYDAVFAIEVVRLCWLNGCVPTAGPAHSPEFLDLLHAQLDIMGAAGNPFADALNSLLYAAEGDWANATLAGIGMVPVGGDAAGLARLYLRGAKIFRHLDTFQSSNTVWRHISNAHIYSSTVAGKSRFAAGIGRSEIDELVRKANNRGFIPVQGANGDINYATFVDAGRNIGKDRAGRDTNWYSVIVNENGHVQSVHPGFAGGLP